MAGLPGTETCPMAGPRRSSPLERSCPAECLAHQQAAAPPRAPAHRQGHKWVMVGQQLGGSRPQLVPWPGGGCNLGLACGARSVFCRLRIWKAPLRSVV
eukprot:364654-Chlamydomonas_euryale.AAC.6